MEVGLDVIEDDHGTVSTSSLELSGLGEADSIVEGETEDFVSYIGLVSMYF